MFHLNSQLGRRIEDDLTPPYFPPLRTPHFQIFPVEDHITLYASCLVSVLYLALDEGSHVRAIHVT